MNWELLVGLIGIAIAIFFGLWSFTKGFRDEFNNITTQLANIQQKVAELTTKLDTAWQFVLARLTSGGTIQRILPNLGKVQISVSPLPESTQYDIRVEKVELKGGLIEKASKDTGFWSKEIELLGEPSKHMIITPHMMRLTVPSVDAKVCTEFMTSYLKWLDTTYVESLRKISEFEEPILPSS